MPLSATWRTLAFLADPGSADDLTQETYLRAIGALPYFRWPFHGADLAVVDRAPSRGRPDPTQPGATRSAAGVDLEAVLNARPAAARFEEIVEINMLLDGLDPDRRDALMLTQVMGLSMRRPLKCVGARWGRSALGWPGRATT